MPATRNETLINGTLGSSWIRVEILRIEAPAERKKLIAFNHDGAELVHLSGDVILKIPTLGRVLKGHLLSKRQMLPACRRAAQIVEILPYEVTSSDTAQRTYLPPI